MTKLGIPKNLYRIVLVMLILTRNSCESYIHMRRMITTFVLKQAK